MTEEAVQTQAPKKKNFFLKHLFDFLLLGVLALGTASAYIVRAAQKSQAKPLDLVARITKLGQELMTINLYEEGETERNFTIEGTKGKLTVGVKKNAIHVHDAECPGQECVHEGWVMEPNHPIICAHNGIYISISSYDWSEVIIR